MSKNFWIIIALIVVVVLGVAIFNSKKETANNPTSTNATNHLKGKADSTVKLVEYGDFQCPACYSYYPVVKQVAAEYGDRVSVQFRNFPLSIHLNARAASRAAEAASKQGKFWEMHDLLFENADPNGKTGWVSSNAPTTFFNTFAKEIGIDVEQFKTDFASNEINSRVNADLAAGEKLGVEGTPTFFLDGKKISVNASIDEFRKALDAALAKQ